MELSRNLGARHSFIRFRLEVCDYAALPKGHATTTAFYVKPTRDAAVEGMRKFETKLAGRKALAADNGGGQ
jgi:hypothetical protein